MPRTRKKGYREGTTHPTYGYSTTDYHYTKSIAELKNELCNFTELLISNIRDKISYKSLEGKYILKTIREKYKLVRPDIEKAEKQIENFNQKQAGLKFEIEEHNQWLKTKCILGGLLIITIPFCYAHYQEKKRDFYNESIALRRRLVDNELQESVKRYNSKLKKYEAEIYDYKSRSSNTKNSQNDDINDTWYKKAKIALKNKNWKDFVFDIIKSAEKNNPKAIFLLAKIFENPDVFKQGANKAFSLFLYSSYLGNKKASKKIANILLQKNNDNEFAPLFLNKSQIQ